MENLSLTCPIYMLAPTPTLEILDTFCKQEKVSRAEGVRIAVRRLKNEK